MDNHDDIYGISMCEQMNPCSGCRYSAEYPNAIDPSLTAAKQPSRSDLFCASLEPNVTDDIGGLGLMQ